MLFVLGLYAFCVFRYRNNPSFDVYPLSLPEEVLSKFIENAVNSFAFALSKLSISIPATFFIIAVVGFAYTYVPVFVRAVPELSKVSMVLLFAISMCVGCSVVVPSSFVNVKPPPDVRDVDATVCKSSFVVMVI